MRSVRSLSALVLLASLAALARTEPRPLKVGVTLHPYYSWVANIVGATAGVEVVGVIPAEVDAGNYQPSPDDIKRLRDLDAIVINGAGHDDFIGGMIRASGNRKIDVIRANDETPMIRAVRGGKVNSHTFISFANAIQQTYFIERRLSALRPEHADSFHANAAVYAARLRKIKAEAATRLADARITRVVTVHDGYSYLLQEFGIEVAAVVEPAHGLVPSARELEDLIQIVKRERIAVVFSEATFPQKLLDVLRDEAGVKIYIISHIATGPWTADQFEREMGANVAALVQALVTDPR